MIMWSLPISVLKRMVPLHVRAQAEYMLSHLPQSIDKYHINYPHFRVWISNGQFSCCVDSRDGSNGTAFLGLNPITMLFWKCSKRVMKNKFDSTDLVIDAKIEYHEKCIEELKIAKSYTNKEK